MKKAIFKTLERFNDDNTGTFEAVIFVLFLTLIFINLLRP